MRVTFDHSEDIAENIRSFWFAPEKPVDYIAGQFTEIRLPHAGMDERNDKRWFTLSSSPTDPLVSITTKFTPQKGSSFKRALAALKPGSPLTLADPMGDFVLPKDKLIPLLFVAAGMGITPMHSMIKWLHDTNERRQIHLVHGVTQIKDLAWRNLFENSNIAFTPIVKTPPPGWNGETGSLSAECIVKFVGDDNRLQIYLSGPEVMIEKFVEELPKLGIDKTRLVTDYFPGYPEV